MKHLSLFLLTLCLATIFVCCKKEHKLNGKWKRIDDIYTGLTIEVTSQGDIFIGKIISLPDTMKYFQYKVGDVIWCNFKQTTNTKYEFRYLRKGYGFLNEYMVRYDYYQMYFKTEDTVYTRCIEKGFEHYGIEQTYVRIKQ